MNFTPIYPSTFKFLKTLSKNNNRDWFNKNKSLYLDAHENMISFVDSVINEMSKHDHLENESGKKSLLRIYNDVRFSKDKAPYNPRFAFRLKRATKLKRGGYYMNIKPGNTFIACGFFAPNPEDLKRIREDIAYNYEDWYKLLSSKNITDTFGILLGEQVSTAPRGFDKNQEGIELIRHKQFILRHDFTDEEVMSKDFLKKTVSVFKAVRPFFDHMSEVLTTDANGVIIV